MHDMLRVADLFVDLDVLHCQRKPTLSDVRGRKTAEISVISARKPDGDSTERTSRMHVQRSYYNVCSRDQSCQSLGHYC